MIFGKNFIDGVLLDPRGQTVSISRLVHGIFVKVKLIESSSFDLDEAIESSKRASLNWHVMSRSQRLSILDSIISAIEQKKELLAEIEAESAGKKKTDAIAEISVGISHWKLARSSLELFSDKSFSYVENSSHGVTRACPIGLVGLIVPYNFPFIVISERLPYLLAAGCTAIIKPSEICHGSILMLVELLVKSGLPPGVINVLQGSGKKIGKLIVQNSAIKMISFTGSTDVGRQINIEAAKNFKKVSLELGGNNAAIIDSDANIELAVSGVIAGFTYHSGQCCISTNRLYVHNNIKKIFVEKLIQQLNKSDSSVLPDPIILEEKYLDLKNKIAKWKITKKIIFESNAIGSDECRLIKPVVVESNLDEDIEIFGPVLFVSYFDSLSDAINLANKTRFGLSCIYFGTNISRIESFISQTNAGRLWVNGSMKSLNQLPLGGIKESGVGKEAGVSGIGTYLVEKAIVYNY